MKSKRLKLGQIDLQMCKDFDIIQAMDYDFQRETLPKPKEKDCRPGTLNNILAPNSPQKFEKKNKSKYKNK